MTEIQYLTIDHVIEFHDEALREFGGLDGIRSRHELAAAVMQPQQSAFGEDAPDKQEKATQTVLEQAELLSEMWAV
jgi:prophage maintenance system killer protein